MNKYIKYLIAFLISIVISVPLMFISLHTQYSYEKYPCYQMACENIADAPTGIETTGWPLPVCSEVLGVMPGPGGDRKCEMLGTNMIIDFSFIFLLIFVLSIILISQRKRK